MKVFLVADDLTGALDSGVALAKNGFNPVIELKGESCNGDTVIADASSRHLDAKDAYKKVFNLVRKNKSAELIYKKTDSVLRGNIGAELAAAMDAAGERQLWFVPAYPDNGRITKRGVQYVNGLKIAESNFGKDPFEPVKLSNIADIINGQTDKRVVNLSSDFLMCEDDMPAIFVVDAETNMDLEKISEKLFKDGRTRCVAGCGGFAKYLRADFSAEPADCFEDSEGLIVVSGSVATAARAQISDAAERGFKTIVLDERQKNGEPVEPVEELTDTVIFAAADRDSEYSENILPEMVAEVLADAACMALKIMPKAALCVFGGDTLRALLEKLNVVKIYPICEIENGVVVSQISTEKSSHRLISKSGGFGGDDIIYKIRNYPKILPRK